MTLTPTFRALSIVCCLAGALFAADASAQSASGSAPSTCGDNICQDVTCMAMGCPVPESPSNCPQDCNSNSGTGGTVCFPGSDLTCSPKVQIGSTKPSETKKGLVLKRNNLPFNQSDIEVIAYGLDGSGNCGVNGKVCPTKAFPVGLKFTGQAASVTATIRGSILARSSEVGSACGSLYMDLYQGTGNSSRIVLSRLVGRSCDQPHQSSFYSTVLTNLKSGEDYEIRGRFECSYSKIPQATTGAGAGHFLCSTYGSEVTLVWPFGVK